MKKMNSHAPEILTHINDDEHSKGNVFGKKESNPKAKQGCYANAEGKNEK